MIHAHRQFIRRGDTTACLRIRRYPALTEAVCIVVGGPVLAGWAVGLAAVAGTRWAARRLLP